MRQLAVLWLALASSGLGCDRAPAATAPHPARVVADAAPADPAKPAGSALRMVEHGAVIDLRKARVAHVLQPTAPTFEANDRVRAYVVGKDGALRAYDLASGAELWNAGPAGDVRRSTQGEEALFFPRASEVWVVDKATGAARTWTSSRPVIQVLPLGARTVVLREDDTADILDARTGQVEVSAPLPFGMRAWHAQLVASPRGGFCAVGTPVGDMEIACLDDRGRVLWRKAYGLRRAGDTGSPGFSLRSVGPRYAIFGTLFFGAEVHRSVVVDIADGAEIARVEEEVAAVVERDDGSLEGLLVVQPQVKLLEPNGRPRWSAGALAPSDQGAAAVASGTRVYAALYPPISSGSELYAFDRATGKVLWKGDVERPSVGHSEYENEVSLSVFEDRLVLRAEESAVTGLQVFSLPDGKRLFSDMRFRE